MAAWAGVNVGPFIFCAHVSNAIGLYMGAVFEQMRFATGSWTIGHLVLGSTLGDGAGFAIRDSTLGAGRWCNRDVCTLGGGRGGVGGTGGLNTLGDWRGGNFVRGAIGSGRFSGFPGDAHRWHASRKAGIALSWASYTVVEVSLMDHVSVLMLWRMLSTGVTAGAVIY